jgi:hypothetical protein
MADLTIGEVGVALNLTINSLDSSVDPPVATPMNLTGAIVTLIYTIGTERGGQAVLQRAMQITNPLTGQVQYVFQSGDLVKPGNFSISGTFLYSVKVQLPGGSILYTENDDTLIIKDAIEDVP